MSPLPTTTTEITAEWMSEALRGSGVIGAEVAVAEVLLDPTGAGLGFIPVINGPLNQAGSAIYEASLPGFMEAFGTSIESELESFVADYSGQRQRIIDDLGAMPHTLGPEYTVLRK